MIFRDKLKSFSALYEKLTEPVREQYHLTQLEFDILMFLHSNPQHNTANEIVKIQHLAKSHVSTTVSSLEKKGLLTGSNMPDNRKSFLLELTPAAGEIIAAGKAVQTAYGDILTCGFSDAETEQLRELFLRLCDNADEELNRRK